MPILIAADQAIAKLQAILQLKAKRAVNELQGVSAELDRGNFDGRDTVDGCLAGRRMMGEAAAGADPDAAVGVGEKGVGGGVVPDEPRSPVHVAKAAAVAAFFGEHFDAGIATVPEVAAQIEADEVGLVGLQAIRAVKVIDPQAGAVRRDARNAGPAAVAQPEIPVGALRQVAQGVLPQTIFLLIAQPFALVAPVESAVTGDPDFAEARFDDLHHGSLALLLAFGRQQNGLHFRGARGQRVEPLVGADPHHPRAIHGHTPGEHVGQGNAGFAYAGFAQLQQLRAIGGDPDVAGGVASQALDDIDAGQGDGLPLPTILSIGAQAKAIAGGDPNAILTIADNVVNQVTCQALRLRVALPFLRAEPAQDAAAGDANPN